MGIVIASRGQTFMQQPQATHAFVITVAFLFIVQNRLLFVSVYKKKVVYSVTKSQFKVSEVVINKFNAGFDGGRQIFLR